MGCWCDTYKKNRCCDYCPSDIVVTCGDICNYLTEASVECRDEEFHNAEFSRSFESFDDDRFNESPFLDAS